MMIVQKKKQGATGIPLLITLVIILLHNLNVASGVDLDLGTFQRRALAVTSGQVPSRIVQGDSPSDAWAAAATYDDSSSSGGTPGLVFVRRLEGTVTYGFNLTAAFIFPAGFEFATASPVRELRGAKRLTQIFYSRVMASIYPQTYMIVDVSFDSGFLDEDFDFPYILLNFNTSFTFREFENVGVPTANEVFLSSLANQEFFLDGAGVNQFNSNPNGWDPRDYAKYTRQDGGEIFGSIEEASVLFVTQLPTAAPSESPTMVPSASPSDVPSKSPTAMPSPSTPTTSSAPSNSARPSNSPSIVMIPSDSPSEVPSKLPTKLPSAMPSRVPTSSPTDGNFAFTATNQNVPTADFNIISSAFEQLNSIVTGDISSQTTDGSVVTFNPNARDCNIPTLVDDLHICISYNVDLLENNVLGRAGVLEIRSDTDRDRLLPIVSAMDLRPNMTGDPEFLTIVRHEAMHTLGIGILWPIFGLVENDNTANCQYDPDTFAGAQFRQITGCDTSFSIPLQPTTCAHWEQDCFGSREIMNPQLETDPLPVISVVTIGSLQDMGYTVDYVGGDSLSDEDFSRECMCSETLTSSQKFEPMPPISDSALAEANASGRQYLNEMKSLYQARGGDEARTDGSTVFVGHKAVSVVIRDGPYIREVIVRE